MSLWSRLTNIFRADRLRAELEEELRSHVQQAVEEGRDPAEAHRAFGSLLRYQEETRDTRVFVWLDSLRADVVFGWRQLVKNRVTSIVAVLSLALAIGASTSAFRLIDALLWRPMPVAHADRLYAMFCHGAGPDGAVRDSDSNEYPQFLQMRATVSKDADLIAVSWVDLRDLSFAAGSEIEKARLQYVSGWMFRAFGLKPALGRLLSATDDNAPRAHPYAVLAYDYWVRRFGHNPKVIGHTFQMGPDQFQIVGVASQGFTGTETGTFTDIFLPATMAPGYLRDDWSWIRTFIQMRKGGNQERVRKQLQQVWKTTQSERAKAFTNWPPGRVAKYLSQTILLEPASAGLSEMRQHYRVALAAIAVIVGLVLLIAAANVANLLTAQAAVRSREMALRVSIGAGRARLMQMMLVESWLLALFASLLGAVFAWWAAPFIVSQINPSSDPARLALPADWRVLAFAVTLSLSVTLLFGLIPALRASGVKPASALKGGADPHSRRRLMHALLAAQVAFCFVVHFGAGLFVSTLQTLSRQPTGFSAERILLLDTVVPKAQSVDVWNQVADGLRSQPGVERVALSSWPLLGGSGMNGFVSVNGGPPGSVLAYFLNVSPGWRDTMKISLLAGRDFRPDELSPSVALVNQAFAKEYFPRIDPVGRFFSKGESRFLIVGVVRDARYRNMREPITPTAYLSLLYPPPGAFDSATVAVKTSSDNPLALAPALRREVSRTRSEFRVSNVRTQVELNRAQTVRERLLAMIATFFSAVGLLLAGIGLYGILSYSVLQRRRELGIRIAIGAPARDIVRRVTSDVFSMLLLGSTIGAGAGLFLEPYVKTLLYPAGRSGWSALLMPLLAISLAALCAAVPAVVRAIRIDAVAMLRAE